MRTLIVLKIFCKMQKDYVELKNQATELIGFLEDKYHLK